MSCRIKDKTIKYLQDKDIINKTREVLDLAKFQAENKRLTDIAYRNYGVGNNQIKLFKEDYKSVIKADGSRRLLVRAVPNEILFNSLDEQVSIEEPSIPVNNLLEINKPIIDLEFIDDEILLDYPNALELKKTQDNLKKEYKKLNDLINCLWGS
jgi:hypothetical protein